MTTCDSHASDGESCRIAVLFRTHDGTGERIRGGLRKRKEALIQFAPKGSYRFEQVMEFLQWSLARAAPEEATIVFLDWFAPHLHLRIDEFLMEGNNACLRIGGGTTPYMQSGDTRRHGPYTKAYKKLETENAERQLRLRPRSLPSCSRQTVMVRACDAWLDTKQDNQK